MDAKKISRAALAVGVVVGLLVPGGGAAWAGGAQEEGEDTLAGEETAAAEPSSDSSEVAKAPDVSIYLADLSLLRWNPLGLETQNRLMIQKRLMDSDSILFGNTLAAGGLSLKLNPAYVKVGPMIEVQPIALFNLRAAYEYFYYFGTLGYLQSSPDASYDYSDETRSANEAAAYSTSGHHFYVEPLLQAKVGGVVVRTKFAIEYWKMSLRGGDSVFYDPTLDTQVPGQGWTLANDTDLLYLGLDRLTVGLRWTGVWPQYSAAQMPVSSAKPGLKSQLAESLAEDPPSVSDFHADGNKHQRLGPLFAYSFKTREGSRTKSPALLAILGWYLDHPNREGAVPYILLAYTFRYDFR